MNPIDARDILAGDANLLKVPVLAALATVALGDKASLRLVWEPFFTANKIPIFGQDFSVLTPGSLYAQQVSSLTNAVDPSVQGRVQDALVGTKLPNASPINSTVAARLQAQAGPVDLGLSGVFGWNRSPDLYVDPDLQSLAGTPLKNALGSAAALRLFDKLQAGATLIDAHYTRTGTIAIDAALAKGDFTFKLDVGVSPNTALYTDTMRTLHRMAIRSVLGVEYHYQENFQAVATAYVNNIANLEPGERLLFFEPAGISDTRARISTLAGVVALVRWQFWDQRIALSAIVAYNYTLGDHAIVGRATYNFNDFHHLSAGVLFLQGPVTTIFGYFGRNDEAWLEYRFSF